MVAAQSDRRLEAGTLFQELIADRFKDVRTQDERRDEFDSLRQEKTAQGFYHAIQFKRMYLKPAPTDDECLLLFKRGLNTAIRNRMEILPDSRLPQTFDEYVRFADKTEVELLHTVHRKNLFGVRNSRNRLYFRPTTHSKKDAEGDTHMTLNSMRTASNPTNVRRGDGTTLPTIYQHFPQWTSSPDTQA
ncbi:hypothetical protein LTR93_011794 [Exophiala xenobiotica]|nr:hypothetical protein LTR93_011794 [Exophiala xenobiotica]